MFPRVLTIPLCSGFPYVTYVVLCNIVLRLLFESGNHQLPRVPLMRSERSSLSTIGVGMCIAYTRDGAIFFLIVTCRWVMNWKFLRKNGDYIIRCCNEDRELTILIVIVESFKRKFVAVKWGNYLYLLLMNFCLFFFVFSLWRLIQIRW